MADLSDVTAYLAGVAATAVYPNGTGQSSVAAMDCRIYEGWPIADQLDLDMAGKMLSGSPPVKVARPNGPVANVSVYPMPGTGIQVYQILDQTYTIVPVSFGLTVTVSANTVTITGTAHINEWVTVVVDNVHIYYANTATPDLMVAVIATEASNDYSDIIWLTNSITFPSAHSVVARQGGIATLGKVTHRQRQSVMVSVWAPTRVVRNSLSSAIDNLIKQNNVAAMPDTSEALICYSRTNVSDEQQMQTIYRRDLIYDVEYATVQQFPGYVITSVTTSIAKPDNSAIANAIV